MKQRYSVLRLIWKLAVPDYGNEPIERLLERSNTLVSELEGNPDISMTGSSKHKKTERLDFYPEPSGRDHFLDYAESQGWI
ncbi:hypothetical protein D3C78_1860030 [compost metagenome]